MDSTQIRHCHLGLEVLDLDPSFDCVPPNIVNYTKCEEEWPCEVRQFWQDIHPFVDVSRSLLFQGTITFIIIGTILNILSFYILLSSGLSKNGSGVYLLVLVICDTGNLVLNYAVGVTRAHSNRFNHLFMHSEYVCRIHAIVVVIFQAISAWVVVSFTIERCLAVWFPMFFRANSHKHRSKVVLSCVISICTFFSLFKLLFKGFEKDSVFGYKGCPSNRILLQGMSYGEIAVQTWLPAILVFLFNCLMFAKLRSVKARRKHLTGIARTRRVSQANNNLKRGLQQSFVKKRSATTPMLITVSLAYLILVFPLGAVQTIEIYWNMIEKPVATEGLARVEYISWITKKLLIKTLRTFFFGLYQINFCINFFLYFAAGVQFRRHLSFKFNKLIRRIRTMFSPCQNFPQSKSQIYVVGLSSIPSDPHGNNPERRHSLSDPCIFWDKSANNISRGNSGVSSEPSSNATMESNLSTNTKCSKIHASTQSLP